MTPDSKLRSAVIPAGLFRLTESWRAIRQINHRHAGWSCVTRTRRSAPLFCKNIVVVTRLRFWITYNTYVNKLLLVRKLNAIDICLRWYKGIVNFILRNENCNDISFNPLCLKTILKLISKLNVMGISSHIGVNTIRSNWSLVSNGSDRQQSVTWNMIDPSLRRHMASLGHNGSNISHINIIWKAYLNPELLYIHCYIFIVWNIAYRC